MKIIVCGAIKFRAGDASLYCSAKPNHDGGHVWGEDPRDLRIRDLEAEVARLRVLAGAWAEGRCRMEWLHGKSEGCSITNTPGPCKENHNR